MNLEQHLKAAWDRRKAYVKAGGLQAYRLANREEISNGEAGKAVGVDVYGDYGVLQLYDPLVSVFFLEELEEILSREFRLKRFFHKNRYRVKDSPEAGGELGEPPVELEVEEYGHKFLVNLNNYLDTGLFLDHRETRRRVAQMVEVFGAMQGRGARVLNLFAYTGSFSVYAAAAGAEMTHTVDLSKTYCDWARRNLDLNGFAPAKNWVYRMDTFEFYKYAARKGLRFDLIIIDPPTFSRNKGNNFSVMRDQVALIEGAAELLDADGQMIFSNNCLDFELDEEIRNKYKVQDIQSETVPLDFWIDTQKNDFWKNQQQIHNCYLIGRK
ncbi:class I SAM-dependent rRNA methyltransferase [Candidatus Peregrinibacteria bacterium]|nr:class I SAM-dependent rRNA methyltransferase [Candidatus Peregrinibacteria bacterium]